MEFERFINELKSRLLVSDVVGEYVRLTRHGREWKGLSPFSSEKTPSFTVNDQKQFWHCFSSGEHGDIISFLTKTQNMTFWEAAEVLAKRAGIEMPSQKRQDPAQAQRAKTTLDALQAASEYFQSQLLLQQNKRALDYLRQRGISQATIKKFGLGFAPTPTSTSSGENSLRAALHKKNFSDEILLDAGLIIKPDEPNKKPYDRFRGRITFPIDNRKGEVIAFGARALDSSASAKYLNSPETALFHKGSNFYAISKAAKPSYDKGQLIIVEGYMDVIALHQAGCENVVASLGTALTEQQVELAWRFADEPVVCLDGDEAGQRAARRAIERALKILRAGKSLRFAYMPKGKDPDDLIKQAGLEAFEKHISAAEMMSESMFYNETQNTTLETPERRAALRQRFDKLIDEIKDPAVQRYYRNLFHRRLEQLLWQFDRGQKVEKTNIAAPAFVPDGSSEGERVLLGLLIHQPHFLQKYPEDVEHLYLASEPHQHLRDAIMLAAAEQKPDAPDWFYQHLGDAYHHLLDIIYGRDSQMQADGHQLYQRFPALRVKPHQEQEENAQKKFQEEFVDQCLKCFIHEQYHQALKKDCAQAQEDYQAQFNQEDEQEKREHWLKIKTLLEDDERALFFEVIELSEHINNLSEHIDYATGFALKKS